MTHILEAEEKCGSCGGSHLRWEPVSGFLFLGWRVLRCARCLDAVRLRVSPATWIMYAIALAAAVWGWWVVW